MESKPSKKKSVLAKIISLIRPWFRVRDVGGKTAYEGGIKIEIPWPEKNN